LDIFSVHHPLCVTTGQDLFSVFHGRLKCAVSAAVAAIRRHRMTWAVAVAMAMAL